MATIVEVILNNKNATDESLAKIAERAIKSKDEQLLKKLATHPNAGFKTLSLIAQK